MNHINNLSSFKELSQSTLKNKIYFSGIGVHNGRAVSMCIEPADINTGIVFIRTDIEQNNIINATIENAFNAAFNDPRFKKVTSEERDKLEISISLLSSPKPIHFKSEAELLNEIRPLIDGVIIDDLGKKSLFLPSVWAQLPEPKEFLQRLKLKAGLSATHWSPRFKAHRFVAAELSMSDVFQNKIILLYVI